MHARLVVGYDGTEPSRHALRWALARDGDLVIAHVVEDEAGIMGRDYREAAEAHAESVVQEALAQVLEQDPERRVKTVQLSGPVAWALTEYADRRGDLLVIGTHKTGFLHGRMLGSRSVEVALLSQCDVAVIPPTDLRFRTGVVVGFADEPGIPDVLATAARIAAARGDELLIVHAAAQDAPAGAARARELARRNEPGVPVKTRTSTRGAAELLLDAGRDRALIVIGRGRGDRSRSPLGSVLHDVLLNLTAPTLVVGDRGRTTSLRSSPEYEVRHPPSDP